MRGDEVIHSGLTVEVELECPLRPDNQSITELVDRSEDT